MAKLFHEWGDVAGNKQQSTHSKIQCKHSIRIMQEAPFSSLYPFYDNPPIEVRVMEQVLRLLIAALCWALITASPTHRPRLSTNRTEPPPGAVVVDQSGRNSNYTTVQAGINALSNTSTGLQSLFIYPGVYVEQVYIPARAANLTVYGWTRDTSSYQGNTVNVTYNLALINTTSDDLTATVRA